MYTSTTAIGELSTICTISATGFSCPACRSSQPVEGLGGVEQRGGQLARAGGFERDVALLWAHHDVAVQAAVPVLRPADRDLDPGRVVARPREAPPGVLEVAAAAGVVPVAGHGASRNGLRNTNTGHVLAPCLML